MIIEFEKNWRSFDKSFFTSYFEKWEKLPNEGEIIEIEKKKVDEIIVKKKNGQDIFSMMIDRPDTLCLIDQYQGFWNAIYYLNETQKKLVIFTF